MISARVLAVCATVAAAAGAVPLAAAPASAATPTLTRASVVYTADTNGDFYYGIYAAPASNPLARTAILPEPSLTDPNPVDVQSAEPSPDGTKVAALVDRAGNGDYSLEVIDVATRAHTTIATATSNVDATVATFFAGFDWSRDGSTLLYSQGSFNASSTPQSTYALYTRAADASTTAVALTGGTDLSFPAYSQDGTRIAASNLFGTSPGLYVLPAAGGTATKLAAAATGTRFHDPNWSPDDSLIVASLAQPNDAYGISKRADLVTVDPNAGLQAPKQISPTTNVHLNYQRPYFSMDGSLWFDTIDEQNCCSGDLYQAHRTPSGSWSLSDRTPTPNIDEAAASFMRPVDDGAPTSPVTLGAVGLGGTSLTVHWTVPAGLDDYADVTLHRTDVTAATPTVDVPHAAGTRFTFSNLVLGHDYTFTATVYDGSGHAGPDSNLVTATAAGAKVVSVSPTSSAQRSLPFHVTWGLPGQPTQTNPVTYDVSYAVKSGSTWTLGSATHWYTGTSLTGATFTKGVAGQTYYFLATVHDTHGNAGSTAWTGVNVPLDQKAASFSSGWKTLSSTNYWLGTLAYTPVSRAAATFVVTAKGVSVIATKCTTCGWVAIYIDGHKVTAVSTKSSTTRYRQVVWTGSFRSIGKHTVKLVASLGSGQHLGIDGLADPR